MGRGIFLDLWVTFILNAFPDSPFSICCSHLSFRADASLIEWLHEGNKLETIHLINLTFPLWGTEDENILRRNINYRYLNVSAFAQ